MKISNEHKALLVFVLWLIKINWYLIPFAIIMIWGIIATFAQYGVTG